MEQRCWESEEASLVRVKDGRPDWLGKVTEERQSSIREALTGCDEFKPREHFKLETGPVALYFFKKVT